MSTELINALQTPELYDHPVDQFQVIETHISWVILTGDYVYKIKKPVNFGFLDFTSLEQRAHFCREELRLNQRLAPALYLDVLPITGNADAPALNGDGPIIDYAIKLRQFPQENLLDQVLARDALTPAHITELGRLIADFHQQIDTAPPESRFGTPDQVYAPVGQNFDQIRPMLDDPSLLKQLDHLQAWAESTFARLKDTFGHRKAEGFIRECHGDIHLGNITLVDGQVVLFDCIEFNDDFRWTDVACDLAFILMDLQSRGLQHYARQLLGEYLEVTGDYESLEILRFYKAYRAMVRAKIALFTRAAPGMPEEKQKELLESYAKYAELADSYTLLPNRVCFIGQGVCGSGKSTVGRILNEEFGALPLRSDVERKRLFQLPAKAASGSPLDGGIYTPEASARTYQRLEDLARMALMAGYPVFIDATNLAVAHRDRFQQVAEETGVASVLISCQTPEATVRQWVEAREKAGQDASEAGVAVLEKQLTALEPLTDEERTHAIIVDAANAESIAGLVARIRCKLGGGCQ